MSSFVVISIVVLILAFVPAHGPNATAKVGIYTIRCAIWHGPDPADKIPVGQRLNLQDSRILEVLKLFRSNLWNSTMQVNGRMSAFGRTLGEEETQPLVAHVHESAGAEKWLWQPATAS
jgi:hypothetical protein